MSPCAVPITMDEAMESKDLTNVKESKDYVRGDESTDDQSSSCGGEESTDESSTNSDGDSLHSSRKRNSAHPAESPSRKGSMDSNASTVEPETMRELLPSLGSAGHFTAECQPCCFFPKGRCSNGQDCNFCHFDHEARPRRSKRGSKNKTDEKAALASDSTAQAALASDSSIQAPIAIMPAAAPLLSKPPGLPTPKGNHCSGFCPMLVTFQTYDNNNESQETMHPWQATDGKPMKVWLPEPACSSKQLDRTIPAKKRPPYPELIKSLRPALDPSQPVKKKVPIFTEGFLEGAFSRPEKCVSATPAASVFAPR